MSEMKGPERIFARLDSSTVQMNGASPLTAQKFHHVRTLIRALKTTHKQ